MQLKVEKWLSEQTLGKKVTPLFDEAIKSYKAGAYKAGLLFSYLGFMTILKERIINSQNPPGIPSGMWTQLQTDVQNRESWDKKVFEATQIQRPAEIFPISDTIRREVVYWKDRRNDCAHFKHEKIDYHHVESFWSFLDTNLAKFTVNGGRDALIRKFKDHFDLSLTSPSADFTPLVVEIESAVDTSDLRTFYDSLLNEIDNSYDGNTYKVYNKVLDSYNSVIADELIEFIKADDERALDFIRTYPQKVPFLNFSPAFIRSLWYDKLFLHGNNDYNVYTSLLQNNLIPTSDINEANTKVVSRLSSQLPNAIEFFILNQNSFFERLRERALPNGGIFSFDFANRMSTQAIFYLENFPINREIMLSIRGTFTNPLQPNTFNSRLRTFINNKPDKKQEMMDVLAQNTDIQLPDRLDFITA
jgi:hypothetical protein